ncbi:MAG: hypothetical protein J7M11_00910 [Elusimicrobia bacterium]|nr:hypothetical protein [Elusimicrobiota bacterium]
MKKETPAIGNDILSQSVSSTKSLLARATAKIALEISAKYLAINSLRLSVIIIIALKIIF